MQVNAREMDRAVSKSVLRRERRKLWLKYGIGTLIVAIAVGVVLSVMTKGVRESELLFSTVDRGNIEFSISATGVVRPAVEEAVVSPIASRLLRVLKANGDSVRAGEPLMELDLMATQSQFDKLRDQLQMRQYELEQMDAQHGSLLSNMEMQLQVMGMQIDQKRVELTNAQRLDSLGGGTAGAVREVELALRVAELEREQLQRKLANERRIAQAQRNVKGLEVEVSRKSLGEVGKVLDEARICAPRRGVLTFINTQVGAQIGAGMQVATVADLSQYRIDGEMADHYAGRIEPGAEVTVRNGRTERKGLVSSLAPTSRNGTMAFTVQLGDSAMDGLRSGLKVELYVQMAKKSDVLRIRNGAYYSKPGYYSIYVKRGSEIVRRKVRLGESSYDHVEVLSGLTEGEQVVISDMAQYKHDENLRLK